MHHAKLFYKYPYNEARILREYLNLSSYHKELCKVLLVSISFTKPNFL